tara:strand:- start:1366 stop:2124 length:759 start_codon:yes stop_codon:yes gene_type:complete
MTEIQIKRTEFLRFLTSFGDVEDLRLDVAGSRLTGEIGFATHYLRKSLIVDPSEIKTEGKLDISDLKKVVSFCKKIKGEEIIVRQSGSGKTLYLRIEKTKLQLPTTDIITSHSRTPMINKLLDETIASMWSTWTRKKTPLEVHGDITVKDIKNASKMNDITGKHGAKVTVNAEEKEFSIHLGKKHTPRLFITTPVTNAQGPHSNIESHFGHWFGDCINFLDNEAATFHMGEQLPLFIEQSNTLLVIINQKVN